MSIEKYFTTSFIVCRMQEDEDVVWGLEESEIDTFYGHIQQLNEEFIENLSNVYTLSHRVWCSLDTDIKVGDRIKNGNIFYNVKAINERNYAGGNKHLEVFVEKSRE